MAALHEALKALGPTDFSQTPLNDLEPFLTSAFSAGQLIVNSVPIAKPTDLAASSGRSRSASSASEIALSSARPTPPLPEVEALQKEWKPVKLGPKDNPLGMSVYKMSAKDGNGAWFARRSVHEGLGFSKWKRGLEREFPETMKVQGGPGEGNIRGIGGERRVEYKNIEGVGKVEVYLLSAQFPGPTTPRDFVTMFLTSDQALTDHTGENEVPRHFMVISKPCIHPETGPREGYIRGSYESVEFIREVPIHKASKKSLSDSNLTAQDSRTRSSTVGKGAEVKTETHGLETDSSPTESRARGKTISFDSSRGSDAKGEHLDVPREDDESESNPVEWIMITRSDPGGSVPRFMVERGTPGSIVSDASKFLNWACSTDIEDLESDDEAAPEGKENEKPHAHHHNHDQDLHNFQTNGHLAGLDGSNEENAPPTLQNKTTPAPKTTDETGPDGNDSGYYGLVAGAVGAASALIASHTPALISNQFPRLSSEEPPAKTSENPPLASRDLAPRRLSTSTISTESSFKSFASALSDTQALNDTASTKTATSINHPLSAQDKELAKLEEKKRKLEEKLAKVREKESSRNGEDKTKEEDAIRKAEEKHLREVKKQEEKYKREVEKLEAKKEKERLKAEDRKRKTAEKDEKVRLSRELEGSRAENEVLKKEREILRIQIGELQAENTALATKVGKLGLQGEEVLKEVREEVGRTGRLRTDSLKGLARVGSIKSSSSGSQERKNRPGTVVNSP